MAENASQHGQSVCGRRGRGLRGCSGLGGQVFVPREQLSLDVIKQYRVVRGPPPHPPPPSLSCSWHCSTLGPLLQEHSFD